MGRLGGLTVGAVNSGHGPVPAPVAHPGPARPAVASTPPPQPGSPRAAGSQQLPGLDGLRAVAALAVLLTHVAFQTGEVSRGTGGALLGRLDVGVAVFFVLSGFLLYRPHAVAVRTGGPAPSARRYAVRRASRILPAYWIALAVVVGTSPAPGSQAVTHLWLGQTYLGSLFPDFTQTWSLCTEVAFYAVLPLAAAAIRRLVARHGPAAETASLASLAVAGYGYLAVVGGLHRSAPHGPGLTDRALLWLPGHLDWFVAGMAVAAGGGRTGGGGRLTRSARQLADWPGTCWAAAGVLLLFATTPVAGPLTLAPGPDAAAVAKELLYAAIALLLLLPAAWGPTDRGLGAVLAHPASRYVGRISYGIFLWHLLVLRAVFAVTGWAPFSGHLWLVALLTVAGTAAAASASWLLVERPVLRRTERIAPRVAGPGRRRCLRRRRGPGGRRDRGHGRRRDREGGGQTGGGDRQ